MAKTSRNARLLGGALVLTMIGASGCAFDPTGQIVSSNADSGQQLTALTDRRIPPAVAGFFGSRLAGRVSGSFGLEQVKVGPSGDKRFSQRLQVKYPANSASQLSSNDDKTVSGGAQVYLSWTTGPVEEAYLKYYVRFPAGFDFVKGGKMPGLFGGTVTSGQHIPDGANGFSTRYMWRAKGAGEVYAYLPTSKEHGTSLGRGDWTFPTGRWIRVEQRVKLNTVGKSDGQIQVWMDGVQVASHTGLKFRTTSKLKIEGIFFSTFFGGSDSSWASPRDQTAEFASFVLSHKRAS